MTQKNRQAKSFVMIMVVIASVALLLRIAIERIISITITQDEANAQQTMKLIAASLESYAKDHQGTYATNLALLTKPSPPYLEKDYVLASPLRGYIYSCPRLDETGYSCQAVPTKCNLSGKTIYTVTTAGMMASEECEKKE